MNFYMVISDKDSLNYYPNNIAHDFRVHTPNTSLHGRWYVGLCELSLDVERECEMRIYSNICTDTLVGGEKRPLLKRLFLQRERNDVAFSRIMYIPVDIKDFHSIRVYMESSVPPKPDVILVLHFKKIPLYLDVRSSKIYVADTKKWADFSMRSATAPILHNSLRQSGGNLGNASIKTTTIVPIDSGHISRGGEKQHSSPEITIVSPTQRDLQQAKSELRRVKAKKRKKSSKKVNNLIISNTENGS